MFVILFWFVISYYFFFIAEHNNFFLHSVSTQYNLQEKKVVSNSHIENLHIEKFSMLCKTAQQTLCDSHKATLFPFHSYNEVHQR